MAISLNQAYDIAQNLSNEQLMQSYTNGTLPQFVLFSEMELRQKHMKNKAQAPTQTVAEKMVGKQEPEGIAAMQPPPQMAAKGGITRVSPLDMGYSEDLPPEARKIISMRLKMMKDLEEPDYNPPQYAAEGDLIESNPLTNKDIARMIMPSLINVESGGNQGAVSGKGATGVAQLMPKTAPEAAKMAGLQWDENRYRKDPSYNAALGHAYLTSMLDRFGDREKALAAYNAGPGRVAGAINRAQATGGDWKSFLPRETQAYIGKVLGGAQSKLPDRQDAEGADLRDPRAFGFDPAFGEGRDATPPSYQYDRRSPLLDPSKMPSEASIDRKQQGIAQLELARRMAGMRRGPSAYADGGPVYLAGGTDDQIVGDYVPSDYQEFPSGGMSSWDDKSRVIQSLKPKPPQMSISPELSQKQPEETSTPVGRLASTIGGGIKSIMPDVSKSDRVLALQKERDSLQIGPFTPETDSARAKRLSKIDEIDRKIQGIMAEKPANFEDPRVSATDQRSQLEEKGIPSAAPPAPNMPEVLTQKPSERGIPSAVDETTPSAGRTGETPPAGAGGKPSGGMPSIGERPDSSFKTVMNEVKAAIGGDIPKELESQMKDHQKNLAQMKNDKVVDALFAAAKTLAGQRKGSVNFADAVANSGLAAQEAQKRIYKAEDDMRKYRADFMKAQYEGDIKAANIAMSRINNEETNRKGLQTAMMQANRMIQAQEASEKKTNIGVASKELILAESKLADFNRMLADPSKIGVQDQKTIEAERRRLEADVASAHSNLIYWQTGATPDAIRAELIKRGIIK